MNRAEGIEVLVAGHAMENRPALLGLDEREVHPRADRRRGVVPIDQPPQQFEPGVERDVPVRDRAEAERRHVARKQFDGAHIVPSPSSILSRAHSRRSAARKPARVCGGSMPRGS